MAQQLRYLYKKGERFAYTTTVHTVAQDPGSETRGRKTETLDFTWRNEIEVTEATDELYTFRLVVSGQIGSPPRTCTFSHDPTGNPRSEPDDVEQYQRPIRLPAGPVEVGDTWTEGGLELTLESFETVGSDTIAIIKADCELDLKGPEAEGTAVSTTRFSIGTGRAVDSKGLTFISFEGGRTVKTTADSRLE